MTRKDNLQTLIAALDYELEAAAPNGTGDVNRLQEARGIARRRLNAMAEDEENREAERLKGVPPVDRSARILASGEPVPEDRSHTALKPSGQQQDYIVLTESERHKGYVRRYRDAYRHIKCGKITTMSRAIAETFARDPYFYSGTFCSTCCGHFPIGEDGEFTWYEMNGTTGPKVGT
jgi:hypothetical protein